MANYSIRRIIFTTAFIAGLVTMPCFAGTPSYFGNFDATYKLATQGNAVAQYWLGVSYINGKGIPQDDTEAVLWFRKSALQGYTQAQTQLGFMYEYGWGMPSDYVQAYLWYSLAVAQGDVPAQKDLRELETKMSPHQIADAQRLVRAWKPTH